MTIEFNSRKKDGERRKEEQRIEEQRKIPCFADKDRRLTERRSIERRIEDRRGKENRKIKIKRSKEFKRHVDAQI